ncbi:MAG: hypothetical protein LQ340_003329 [Diploschistes diacapsis]|nr:MAG: hypothetical protein LQ340_003329 [Diploschistes diacapsis]
MTEDNSRPPMEGVGQRIDMDKTLSYMVSVMTSLIGGMATQGSSDQAMTLEDLPRWLENNAAVARKIVENFPQKVEAAPEKPVDTVSEDQWKLVISKRNGKVVGILPENDVAERWFCEEIEEEIVSKKAISSYDAAVERCREKVKSIIEDCERKNQKFRDPEFALDDQDVCLRSLVPDPEGDPYSPPPQSVARTRQIFPSPKLFVNGAKADDVRQGTGGDCWFLAAVAALTNLKEGLHHNYVHVDGDEKVGVYGFVFHRGKDAPLIADMRELTVVDGEWIYEIVDDFLYCRNPVQGRLNLENSTDAAAPSYWGNAFEARLLRSMDEEKYTNTFLSGADALYFSQCRDENETWLPLLEKAYAKAHGDYQAIEGGFTGEAIEDLTGGITTEIKTEDILDLDRMWEELLHCNQEYIFGCWTPSWPNSKGESQGLHSCHAYSVMKAQELVIDGSPQRLVLVRNPWGNSEWTGPYSDGSKEWTIDLMQKLGHRFGDDGIFWMSCKNNHATLPPT